MATDTIYFIGPKRGGGWTVRRVMEHGRHHDRRPATWRGPYTSALDADHAADAANAADFAAHRAADPHCTCNDCIAHHEAHTS